MNLALTAQRDRCGAETDGSLSYRSGVFAAASIGLPGSRPSA